MQQVNISDVFNQLTGVNDPQNVDSLIKQFAGELGWNPSYFMDANSESFSNGHLIVEYGLENTAVISFLKKPYYELNFEEKKRLINISYNNLVDWHLPIDSRSVTYIFNRNDSDRMVIDELRIERGQYDNLRSDAFQKVIGKKTSNNIPTLDNVLIQTISNWKRIIYSEFPEISNGKLSTLFNTIMFIRAVEDNQIRHSKITTKQPLLIEEFNLYSSKANFTALFLFKKVLNRLGYRSIPKHLIDIEILNCLDKFNKADLFYLIKDFYFNQVDNYFYYDFSIISKHALSKIYEKYVSILQIEEKPQLEMFNLIPTEHFNKSVGAYYTPQYLARFFSKFIQSEFSYKQFNNIKVFEPSVGSGIFLRTISELQLESIDPKFDQIDINKIYSNLFGVDIDENAEQATKLSLALLHLLIKDDFPKKLNIFNFDALDYFEQNKHLSDTFDVVVSNPPFIRSEQQTPARKEKLKKFLGDLTSGKSDEYLAFLKIALEFLKDDGIGLFVLPHSFLLNTSAAKLRSEIANKCHIKFIADLSAIQVFGETGIYISLIIFQKKKQNHVINSSYKTKVLKCRNFVGKALEDVLKGNFSSNSFYDFYQVDQANFSSGEWIILSPNEYKLNKKFDALPKLEDFLQVNSGIITGNDEIFMIDKKKLKIPKGEEKILLPLLHDRGMESYTLDSKTAEHQIIYPYLNNKKISQEVFKNKFPTIWKYLLSKKSILAKDGKERWWELHRSRDPEHIFSPKIVYPYLSIVPKFSLDAKGKFGVSHGTYITLKENSDLDELYLFLGIMNSTPFYWYLSNHSHKVNNQYNKIEAKTIKNVPVPDTTKCNRADIVKLIRLVKNRLLEVNEVKILSIEREIDQVVCKLYDLSEEEMKTLIGE